MGGGDALALFPLQRAGRRASRYVLGVAQGAVPAGGAAQLKALPCVGVPRGIGLRKHDCRQGAMQERRALRSSPEADQSRGPSAEGVGTPTSWSPAAEGLWLGFAEGASACPRWTVEHGGTGPTSVPVGGGEVTVGSVVRQHDVGSISRGVGRWMVGLGTRRGPRTKTVRVGLWVGDKGEREKQVHFLCVYLGVYDFGEVGGVV